MHTLAIDVETAKSALLVAIGISIFALLLVLKFVKSVVMKLLLMILFAAAGVLAFNQREALTACINKVRAQEQAGLTIDTTCEFFGRNVPISLKTG